MTPVDLILAALSLAAALLLAFAVLARRLPRRTSADNPEHVAATRAAFMETDAWFAEVDAATGKRLRAVSASERLTAFDVAVVAVERVRAAEGPHALSGVGRAAMWQWDWGGFVLKVNGRLTIHLHGRRAAGRSWSTTSGKRLRRGPHLRGERGGEGGVSATVLGGVACEGPTSPAAHRTPTPPPGRRHRALLAPVLLSCDRLAGVGHHRAAAPRAGLCRCAESSRAHSPIGP
jgi:hypothetical protein